MSLYGFVGYPEAKIAAALPSSQCQRWSIEVSSTLVNIVQTLYIPTCPSVFPLANIPVTPCLYLSPPAPPPINYSHHPSSQCSCSCIRLSSLLLPFSSELTILKYSSCIKQLILVPVQTGQGGPMGFVLVFKCDQMWVLLYAIFSFSFLNYKINIFSTSLCIFFSTTRPLELVYLYVPFQSKLPEVKNVQKRQKKM